MRKADDWTIERWKTEPRLVGLEFGDGAEAVEKAPPLWKDLTVASADARFCLPEVPKGLRLPTAITGRLVQVVGPVRAAGIVLGGAVHGAEDGLAAGWLTAVLPDQEAALGRAGDLAHGIAVSPRSSVAHVKQVLRRRDPHDVTPPPEYGWNEEK